MLLKGQQDIAYSNFVTDYRCKTCTMLLDCNENDCAAFCSLSWSEKSKKLLVGKWLQESWKHKA